MCVNVPAHLSVPSGPAFSASILRFPAEPFQALPKMSVFLQPNHEFLAEVVDLLLGCVQGVLGLGPLGLVRF